MMAFLYLHVPLHFSFKKLFVDFNFFKLTAMMITAVNTQFNQHLTHCPEKTQVNILKIQVKLLPYLALRKGSYVQHLRSPNRITP